MKNKGLNIIEMLVVIILVIAIGVLLFPVIVGYVNNCKMQEDMKMASEISAAMTTVLKEKKISENAVQHATPQLVSNMDGSDFRKAVYAQLGVEEIKGYTKKNTDGELLGVPEFYYTLDASKTQIEIYYGGITEEYKIYPKVGKKLVK